MACTSARIVCGASCVGAVDAPHIHAKVTLFLLPVSASAIGGAIASGRLVLARLLLDALAADEGIHFLDKRLRARKAMAAAARIGDVELLGWMSDTFGCCLDKSMITEAVAAGRREALAWLMERLRPTRQRLGREEEDTDDFDAHSEGRYRYDTLFEALVERLPSVAASCGDLEMVQMVVEPALRHPHSLQPRTKPHAIACVAIRHAVVAALRAGHVGIAQWLRSRVPIEFDESDLEDQVHTGTDDYPILPRGCSSCRLNRIPNRCPLWRMDENAARGRLENVKWFHSNRSEHGCSVAAMDLAATNGHLDVVRWLHDNRTEGCTTAAMDGAARNGHLEILRFLHDHRSEGCSAKALDEAAANGHLDTVQYLVENRLGEISAPAMDGATANGHLDVVRWLMEHNSGDNTNSAEDVVVPTQAAMDRAAANGHLGVLEFLQATSPVGCTAAAIVGAATGGHEEVVRWLLEHLAAECLSFDTTESAVNYAAKNGHTDIIRLLNEHWTGSPTLLGDADKSTTALRTAFVVAAANGHLDTVKWLYRVIPVDHERPSPLIKAFDGAIRGRHLLAARWIQRIAETHLQLPIRNSTLDVAMVAAADRADIFMLEWIKERRPEEHFCVADAPWVRHACIVAAKSDHLEVLQWFSQMYTGVFRENEDTAWGRRDCIRMTASRSEALASEWLTWSESSVGPV